jgi:fructose-bisphosphate aldolase class I
MRDLARYALICQNEGLLPIVEPDVSLSGTHTLEEAIDVNIRVQSELFKSMIDHGVYMAGSILKSNIVNPGKDCPISCTVDEIARANIFVLEQSFPVAMKGANFLSGGQTLEQAAARLGAINRIKGKCPWNLRYDESSPDCKSASVDDAYVSYSDAVPCLSHQQFQLESGIAAAIVGALQGKGRAAD